MHESWHRLLEIPVRLSQELGIKLDPCKSKVIELLPVHELDPVTPSSSMQFCMPYSPADETIMCPGLIILQRKRDGRIKGTLVYHLNGPEEGRQQALQQSI